VEGRETVKFVISDTKYKAKYNDTQ